jgi:hypothetical protein
MEPRTLYMPSKNSKHSTTELQLAPSGSFSNTITTYHTHAHIHTHIHLYIWVNTCTGSIPHPGRVRILARPWWTPTLSPWPSGCCLPKISLLHWEYPAKFFLAFDNSEIHQNI